MRSNESQDFVIIKDMIGSGECRLSSRTMFVILEEQEWKSGQERRYENTKKEKGYQKRKQKRCALGGINIYITINIT